MVLMPGEVAELADRHHWYLAKSDDMHQTVWGDVFCTLLNVKESSIQAALTWYICQRRGFL